MQATSLGTSQTFTITTAGASFGLHGNGTMDAFDLTAAESGFVNFSGSLSGTGRFTKLGSGTSRFSGFGANSLK